MVKTKQRLTGKVPGKKCGTSGCLIDSPGGCDHQHDVDDWVIVKKQRVTILVPAAPLTRSSLTANHGPSHMHHMPPETAFDHIRLPMETSTVQHPSKEHEKNISLAAQKEVQITRKSPPPLPDTTLAEPPRADRRIESENGHQVGILKSRKLLGVSNALKAVKQPRRLLTPRSSSKLATSLNQGLRASNLERKLERAGGLSRWLTSLGLGQFVRIFQGKSLNKYQLVNLTMKKLKDMGASAVGPRRKLIHAIDCVCQPYCFQAS